VRRQLVIDAAVKELKRMSGTEEDPTEEEVVPAVTTTLEPEFRELLGEENLSITKDYFDTLGFRYYTRRLDELLNADALSLSASAREKLVTSLAKANAGSFMYPSVPEETILEAKSFLTPRELSALQSLALEINGDAKSYEVAKQSIEKRDGLAFR
jgi:hypothetical protein